MAPGASRPLPWRFRRHDKLVTCLVVLLTCAVGGIGIMTPSDPLVKTNDTLVLNCTLDDLFKGVDAHDIVFKYSSRYINQDYIRVINNRTASLSYPRVGRHHSGHWFCQLRASNFTGGNPQTIGQQAVIVVDPPVTPKIIGCRVANWQNMTCTWEPKVQNTGLATNQTLYWSLLPPKYYHCPHARPGSCKWIMLDNADSFKFGRTYDIFILAKNNLAETSTALQYFHTQTLVEPNPVKRLRNQTRSTSAILSWEAPAKEQSILYRVRYQSARTLIWQEQTILNNLTMELQDLTAYTHYVINVTCRPGDQSGFWSKSVKLEFNTTISVPDANPAIAPGAFRIPGDPRKTRSLDIFYQAVPAHLRNGPIARYVLSYVVYGETNVERKDFLPKETMTIKVTLESDLAYLLWLQAATVEGINEQLNNTPIMISTQGDLPPTPKKIVSITQSDNVVLVYWSPVEAADGYTVYWCEGSQQHGTCFEELSWMSVDGNTTAYNITLEESEFKQDKLFGVSAERLVGTTLVSSGLDWSDCTHKIDNPLLPPSVVTFADHQQPLSITLHWVLPGCGLAVYIDKFYVYYCKVDQCPVNAEVTKAVTELEIDGDLTDVTIWNLEVTEYKVWMRSHSTYRSNLSKNTLPLVAMITRDGLSKGIVAVIIIAVIVCLFFIVFGLFQAAKVCRYKLQQEVHITFERPPEVPHIIERQLEQDQYGDFMVNYTNIVDQEQWASEENSLIRENQANAEKELPYQPNGHVTARARIYLGSDLAEGHKLQNGKANVRESNEPKTTEANDIAISLLPLAVNADDDDDNTEHEDDESRKNLSPESIRFGILPKVPDANPAQADLLQHSKDTGKSTYISPREGTSGPQSGSTIPSYSRCGMPDEESPYEIVPDDVPLPHQQTQELPHLNDGKEAHTDGPNGPNSNSSKSSNLDYLVPNVCKPPDSGYDSWTGGSATPSGNSSTALAPYTQVVPTNSDYMESSTPVPPTTNPALNPTNTKQTPIGQLSNSQDYHQVADTGLLINGLSEPETNSLTDKLTLDKDDQLSAKHQLPFTDTFTIKDSNNGYVTVNM